MAPPSRLVDTFALLFEVMVVPSDALVLYAVVIALLPMVCFFLSAPAFLLVGLEIPEVMQLLRGLFSGYFLVMSIAGAVAAVLAAAAGRPVFSIGLAALAVFAIAARRWFLQHMDAELRAGTAPARRRLRGLHLKGMLVNAVQLVAVVACVPLIV